MKIQECTPDDSATIAMLVSKANRDVAVTFGLNDVNCPKHPSFCTEDWIRADFARGERYFILEEDSEPIGCVAYETPNIEFAEIAEIAEIAYLNRLSVLPEHRNRGVGDCLVKHVFEYARSSAIKTISIGVIGEHAELQRWYRNLGFVDGETKRFPHLPFSVKYMTYIF